MLRTALGVIVTDLESDQIRVSTNESTDTVCTAGAMHMDCIAECNHTNVLKLKYVSSASLASAK